jgi:hypothetical protein
MRAVEIAADQHELVSCLALEVLRSIEAIQVPQRHTVTEYATRPQNRLMPM